MSGNIRWYLYDGLGSVLGEVDPNGVVTSSRKYDVYGLVRGGTNPGGTSTHKFVGQLGHPSEDNTGLIYMRARYMDPVVGRFISEDAAANGHNWYIYCNNNPIVFVDVDGNAPGWFKAITNEVLKQMVDAYVNPILVKYGIYLDPLGTSVGDLAIEAKDRLTRMLETLAGRVGSQAVALKKGQRNRAITDGVEAASEAKAAHDLISTAEEVSEIISAESVLDFLIGCGGE